MSLSPWTVALISTDYDLKDIRAGLADTLGGLGFRVIAFEQPGFQVQPHVSSHEACVLAVREADIAIIVVDKRYGALYLGAGPESITENEYLAITRKGKIVVPCIRKQAWDARQVYYDLETRLQKEGNSNPRATLTPNYVEDWSTLDFIERIRQADKDDFVITFDSLIDLQKKIEGRLRGITRWLLHRLAEAQIRRVQDLKTTTGMAFSLGDVLQRKYFVEPPYHMKSGQAGAKASISAVFKAARECSACIALLGDPGSGKSTLLGKAYLEHARQSIKEKSSDIPFFLMLRGRGDFSFDFGDYVNKACGEAWQKVPYPLLTLEDVRPTFYMDGLDEMSEEQSAFDPGKFRDSSMFSLPFILSCRSRFAKEYLSDVSIGSRFSAIIELQPWSYAETSKYIEQFCAVGGHQELISGLQMAFASGEMGEIAGNPLLLTLFLWLVEEAGMQVPLDVQNRHALLSRTLETWAQRELGRVKGSGTASKDEVHLLLRAWRLAAWCLYRSRFAESPGILLDHLLAELSAIDPLTGKICEKDSFTGLFDIRPYTNEVAGVIHEQLLEELVAELLCVGMREGSYPFPSSLSILVRWEINQLIRSMWVEASEADLRLTLQNLGKAFDDALGQEDTLSVLQRNQAAYYMGRLEIPEAVNELRNANAREKNLFVKLSIAFGLIKRGQFDIEAFFFKKLQNDPEWDVGNRGYHLFYYQDWHVRGLAPPYKDPGNVSWGNTLSALLRHIESDSLNHVALRRVEILTIRRFVETRGEKGPLDGTIMTRIEHAVQATTIARFPSLPTGFQDELIREFASLRKTWNATK